MTENEKSEFSKRLAKQFEAQGIEIVENPEDILGSIDTPSADEGAIISPGMLPMNLKRRVVVSGQSLKMQNLISGIVRSLEIFLRM